jgi:hypothetical protein
MASHIKTKIDKGDFDFESLMKLTSKYTNLYLSSEDTEESDVVYKNGGLTVFYPKIYKSFLSVVKNSGYIVDWCTTKSEETWLSYSTNQALMIIEIDKNESF